jgi:hypothetical protein
MELFYRARNPTPPIRRLIMTTLNNHRHPAPPATASEHELLSHKEAEASIPDDNPVAGEEDPGAAVEDFVAR